MACCGARRQASAVSTEVATCPEPEVRTARHDPMLPQDALQLLREGNRRYVEGKVQHRRHEKHLRNTLATEGQNPAAAIVACADSRCPIEILFDARPGDLFVLRNAGNTCTHAEGSIVGSLEYSTEHLKTSLILVLGHTKCGAIAGATKTLLANREAKNPSRKEDGGKRPSALEVLLQGLTPVAEQASMELPSGATADEIAAHAVKVNVFSTMDKLLEHSEALRERVRRRELQVHGAIYDISNGQVDFLGQSPNLGRSADSRAPPPPLSARFSGA
uniref:Carbonic anhydrase n=1 Tax=Alexandrium monilatum TaxID=311494 RepID=A0A7S4STY1_9DINO